MRNFRLGTFCLLILFSGMMLSHAVAAEEYPSKPMTCIVPMEAGADGDINMRKVMEKSSKLLGKSIMIVNKPGAGQTVGYREVYASKPEGYTIGTCTASIITAKMQGIYKYDHRDFTLLGFVYHALPILLASKKSPHVFQSMDEIVSYAKKHPNAVSMATTSVGGVYWLSALAIEDGLNVDFNLIPQEGSASFVVTAVAGGHTDLGVTSFASAKAQIEAGNIRFLAVAGPQGYPGKYSHVKTLKEQGYNISLSSFAAILGPPHMSKDVVAKLAGVFEKATKDPEVENFIVGNNMIPSFMPTDQFLAFCIDQENTYRKILAKVGKLKSK